MLKSKTVFRVVAICDRERAGYSHVTDTMQKQAAVKIDRQIGKTDAPGGAKKTPP